MDTEFLQQDIEDFLNPELMRERLISAALYIAAFESLKDSIIQHLRSFYCLDFPSTDAPCEEYVSSVLSRNNSPLYASLHWLADNGAIDENDIAVFKEVKQCRNQLSHNLYKILGSRGLPENFAELFQVLISLQHKVDHWWIVNVEIPTDPEHCDEEYDREQVIPGSTMVMQMLLDIALGDEETARSYLQQYQAGKNG